MARVNKDEEHIAALVKYFHQIFLKPGSGENALHHLLLPGAWARKPLADRPELIEKITCPIGFFYGQKDWMDPKGGFQVCENFFLSASIYITANADHHLYQDNPTDLVQQILYECFGPQPGLINEVELFHHNDCPYERIQLDKAILENSEIEKNEPAQKEEEDKSDIPDRKFVKNIPNKADAHREW